MDFIFIGSRKQIRGKTRFANGRIRFEKKINFILKKVNIIFKRIINLCILKNKTFDCVHIYMHTTSRYLNVPKHMYTVYDFTNFTAESTYELIDTNEPRISSTFEISWSLPQRDACPSGASGQTFPSPPFSPRFDPFPRIIFCPINSVRPNEPLLMSSVRVLVANFAVFSGELPNELANHAPSATLISFSFLLSATLGCSSSDWTRS